MRSRTAVSVLAALLVALMIEASLSEDPVRQAPIKIDRNLRKALLKALADLDTESAEQKSATESRGSKLDEIDLSPSDETSQSRDEQTREPTRTIFSFDDFPSEEETPNEDKLQNSTFVETDKYEGSDNPRLTTTTEILKSHDTSNLNNNRAFQAHDVILKDKSSAIYDKSPEIVYDQLETRSVKTSSAPVNVIDNSGKKPSENYRESLAISSSNGIATANALVPPSPTPSSPTASTSQSTNSTSQGSSSSPSSSSEATKTTSKDEQEVKIFQAPLVAAFTVQQDERGVPKSIVPIYRPSGDGQTLSLQEQLDFKQQLLERQLAELQAQQIQQTQFLVRQQQIYEQQLRQKQQQQLFFQEQSRLKQLQEEQARLKQLEEQRNYQFQAQKSSQLFAQNQQNTRSPLQLPFKSSNVNVQPSLTLELPKTAVAPAFQNNFHDQQRIQQLRQQQLQQQQQAHLQLQQQQQQQQQQQREREEQNRVQQQGLAALGPQHFTQVHLAHLQQQATHLQNLHVLHQSHSLLSRLPQNLMQQQPQGGAGQNGQQAPMTSTTNSLGQRARLPPPGFPGSTPNHMNSFGLGIPRPAPTNNALAAQSPQQVPYLPNGNPLLASQGANKCSADAVYSLKDWCEINGQPQHQQHQHQQQQQQFHHQSLHQKGGWNNFGPIADWTSIDPAIVSSSRPLSFQATSTWQFPRAHPSHTVPHNAQQEQNAPAQHWAMQPPPGFGGPSITAQMNSQQGNTAAQPHASTKLISAGSEIENM